MTPAGGRRTVQSALSSRFHTHRAAPESVKVDGRGGPAHRLWSETSEHGGQGRGALERRSTIKSHTQRLRRDMPQT